MGMKDVRGRATKLAKPPVIVDPEYRPTALPCRPWTAHCRRFLETHRQGLSNQRRVCGPPRANTRLLKTGFVNLLQA